MAEATGSQPPFNFKQSITNMVQAGGSDLHLKVGRPPTIRVAGELSQLGQQPIKPEELKSLAEQIMTPRQVKEWYQWDRGNVGPDLRRAARRGRRR